MGGQVQARRLFAAKGLAGARVLGRFDDQRGGAVTLEAVGEDVRTLQRLGAQALDGVSPERRYRAQVHGPGFALNARERFRSVQNAELRPLGAGELLDRAVTIFVRQFVPIVVVIAVTLVPLTVLEALSNPHATSTFNDMMTVLTTSGSAASRRAAEDLTLSNRAGFLAFVVIFLAVVVRLVMWSAIVSLVAAAYAGSRVTIAQAYRIGLSRWFAQIVVGLAFSIIGSVALVPVFIAYILLVFAVIALAALHQIVLTVIVGVVFGLIVIIAAIILSSWIFMTYQLASVAVVTERPNPIGAISVALSRGLAPGMKRRTTVGGLVVFVVSEVGSLPLVGLGILASAITHVDALYFAIVGGGSVLLEGLVAAFVIVFAVDVRTRREGLDLVVDAPPVVV